jgi:cyclic pyranopterin phosphate synthase
MIETPNANAMTDHDDTDDWTHVDDSGEAQMVDVGDKETTRRRALARGYVYMEASTLDAIDDADLDKGEVSQVARLAGIMGAKKTADLIPLCHPLPLDSVSVDFEVLHDAGALLVEASARTSAKTGVEMEALTAVSTAALTVYDMCKGSDRQLHVGDIHLVEKRGGRSGRFEHPAPPGPEGETETESTETSGERGDDDRV